MVLSREWEPDLRAARSKRDSVESEAHSVLESLQEPSSPEGERCRAGATSGSGALEKQFAQPQARTNTTHKLLSRQNNVSRRVTHWIRRYQNAFIFPISCC